MDSQIKYLSNDGYRPTDGLGAMFQEVLNQYLYCADHPEITFLFTPFKMLRIDSPGLTQENSDLMLNKYMQTMLLPPPILIDNPSIDQSQVKRSRSKEYLDLTVRVNPERLDPLKSHYESASSKWKCYFEPQAINVACHIRVETKLDVEPPSLNWKRDYWRRGNTVDSYFNKIIQELSRMVSPRHIHFHLYTQSTDLNHYVTELQNDRIRIVVHQGDELFDDIHHMIKADIFVASKSSLTNLINYYRRGITISRPFWHELANVIYHDLSGTFSSEQEGIITKFCETIETRGDLTSLNKNG
jgi:hypothetical protein